MSLQIVSPKLQSPMFRFAHVLLRQCPVFQYVFLSLQV